MEAMKELEGTATKEPDKELAGGLKVPGGIWSQLYPLVLLPVCLHLHGDLGMHVHSGRHVCDPNVYIRTHV